MEYYQGTLTISDLLTSSNSGQKITHQFKDLQKISENLVSQTKMLSVIKKKLKGILIISLRSKFVMFRPLMQKASYRFPGPPRATKSVSGEMSRWRPGNKDLPI